MVLAFLVSFPLGSIFVRLPHDKPNIAHAFSLAVSTFFLWPLLGMGRGLLHLLFSCGVTYLIVVFNRSPNMPWMVFLYVQSPFILGLPVRVS